MNKEQKGIAFALSTFFMWGVFPVYFKLLADVGAVQVLAHRIVWSAIILFALLHFSSKLRQVFRLLSIKKVALNLLASGVLISINWGVFIWAVERGQILETSLGYFINPLLLGCEYRSICPLWPITIVLQESCILVKTFFTSSI